MKKYTVVLTGNNRITINEEQKKKIEYAKSSGENYFITIGDESIETSAVKMIVSGPQDPDFSETNRKMTEDSKVFFDGLRKDQNMESMKKAEIEWKIRIEPGLKLARVTLEKRHEQIIKHFIVDFFRDNPAWPYADTRVWWPWLSYFMKLKNVWVSKWFEYVFRHNSQVKYFMETNAVRI